MKKLMINLTNHPSAKWSGDQRKAALEYGTLIDLPFPRISASDSVQSVQKLADEYVRRIMELGHRMEDTDTASDKYSVPLYRKITVCIQGEYTFTYAMVVRLKKIGIKAVTACSDRDAREKVNEDGSVTKESVFRFRQFREYEPSGDMF